MNKYLSKYALVFILYIILVLTVKAEILIVYPKQTDTLFVGKTIKIQWLNDSGSSVSISYSVDSGNAWKLIAKDVFENEIEWKVPYLSNKNIQFKIEETTKTEIRRYWEYSNAHAGRNVHVNCDFSNDGRYYLTSGADGYFRIWDIDSMKLKMEFRHSSEKQMDCAKFWNNTDSVLYSVDGNIYLWTRNANKSIILFGFSDKATYIDINNELGLIAACSLNGEVVLYSMFQNIEIQRLLGKETDGEKDEYYRCRFSRDGKMLAFSGMRNTLNLYDISSKQFKNYKVAYNGNLIWGLDFSFDAKEIIMSRVSDGKIWIMDVETMQEKSSYNDMYNSHIRAVRYVDENNNFISGGVFDRKFLYGNINQGVNIIDSIFMDYEITDVDYHYQQYFGIVGRGTNSYASFTILKLEKSEPIYDISNSNVFYEFTVSIPKVKARYGDYVNFPIRVEHEYDSDNMPFTQIDMFAKVAFPSLMLDFKTTQAPYEIRNFEYVYGFNIDNILNRVDKNIPAKVLLGNLTSAPIVFEMCYSSNEMILYKTADGLMEVMSDCDEDIGRAIAVLDKTSFTIDNQDINNIVINTNIVEDDGYNLTISDIAGHKLYESNVPKSGAYSFLIDKNRFLKGVYFVQLLSENNSIIQKMILFK